MVTDSVWGNIPWDDEYFDSQHPYYSLDGVDAGQAKRLLAHLSEEELGFRSNHSPTTGALLRSIAHHPQVRGNSRLHEGDALSDRFGLSGLILDDPELVAFTPDIALLPEPSWIADLGDEEQRRYRRHRRWCVRGNLASQRWYAARHRYGLDDAVTGPDEIDVVGGLKGRSVLHLWWD